MDKEFAVYVLNKDGHPLMPTYRHGKVRRLLKFGKAKVIRRCPFTIKLLYDSSSYVQPCTTGVDTGSGKFALSVYRDNGDIVYMSEVEVRNDIKKTMEARRKFRRSRRSRKTRYRKKRFDHRGNSIRTGRFSPTMTSKIDAHKREIEFAKKILPIKELGLETGKFDPHLMKNLLLALESIRHWGYQKGANYGFQNQRQMILARDNYRCQCCKGKEHDDQLEVHHIIFKSNGGTDDENNLLTVCHTCHQKIHRGEIIIKPKKINRTLKYATQMNSIRKQLLDYYTEAVETFGFVTKSNRWLLGLRKEHWIDSSVVASKGKPFQIKTYLYKKKCCAKGDFKKTQGRRSEQPLQTGKIQGLKKFDKVSYYGVECFIKGRMSSGYAILMDINGDKIDFSYLGKGKKTPKLSQLKRIGARKTWMVIKEAVTLNTI